MTLSLLQKANVSLGIGLAEGLGSVYLTDVAKDQEKIYDKITIGLAAGGLALMSVSTLWIGGSLLRENFRKDTSISD